jgi:hypothetical protein
MKLIRFTLLILACMSSLQADSLLQNGDFSDGSNHWLGDGKTPDEYAQDNLSAASDPLTSKGLIIPLKEDYWSKVTQDFKGDKSEHYVTTVVYKVSPDLSVSSKPDDYADLNSHIHIDGYDGYGPINLKVGHFFDMIFEVDGATSVYEMFAPKLGSSDSQTYVHPCPPLPDSGNKRLILAFPPGKGTIVILNVSVTNN